MEQEGSRKVETTGGVPEKPIDTDDESIGRLIQSLKDTIEEKNAEIDLLTNRVALAQNEARRAGERRDDYNHKLTDARNVALYYKERVSSILQKAGEHMTIEGRNELYMDSVSFNAGMCNVLDDESEPLFPPNVPGFLSLGKQAQTEILAHCIEPFNCDIQILEDGGYKITMARNEHVRLASICRQLSPLVKDILKSKFTQKLQIWTPRNHYEFSRCAELLRSACDELEELPKLKMIEYPIWQPGVAAYAYDGYTNDVALAGHEDHWEDLQTVVKQKICDILEGIKINVWVPEEENDPPSPMEQFNKEQIMAGDGDAVIKEYLKLRFMKPTPKLVTNLGTEVRVEVQLTMALSLSTLTNISEQEKFVVDVFLVRNEGAWDVVRREVNPVRLIHGNLIGFMDSFRFATKYCPKRKGDGLDWFLDIKSERDRERRFLSI